jgi:hypothetical protein
MECVRGNGEAQDIVHREKGFSAAVGPKNGQFDRKRMSKAKPPFDILRFDIRYSAVRFSMVLRFAARPRGILNGK